MEKGKQIAKIIRELIGLRFTPPNLTKETADEYLERRELLMDKKEKELADLLGNEETAQELLKIQKNKKVYMGYENTCLECKSNYCKCPERQLDGSWKAIIQTNK